MNTPTHLKHNGSYDTAMDTQWQTVNQRDTKTEDHVAEDNKKNTNTLTRTHNKAQFKIGTS